MAVIMGASGSGKTTLFHVLTGIDTPDSGEVEIGGENFTGLIQEETAYFRRMLWSSIFVTLVAKKSWIVILSGQPDSIKGALRR